MAYVYLYLCKGRNPWARQKHKGQIIHRRYISGSKCKFSLSISQFPRSFLAAFITLVFSGMKLASVLFNNWCTDGIETLANATKLTSLILVYEPHKSETSMLSQETLREFSQERMLQTT